MRRTPTLDSNSPYAYLLLCTDFSATGAVAERDGAVVGFVLGYRPPERTDAYFVWQVGVASDEQRRGVARALIEHVLEVTVPTGVVFLEATVTPSNGASWSLFRDLAARAGAKFREGEAFPARLFPDAGHEEEIRLRIGPLKPESLPTQRE